MFRAYQLKASWRLLSWNQVDRVLWIFGNKEKELGSQKRQIVVKNQQKMVLPKKYKALLAIVVILVLCLLLPCSELYWVLVCIWFSCYWLYFVVLYLVVLGILYLIIPSCTWLSFPWFYLVVLCCQVLCSTVPGSLEPGGQTSPTLPSRGRGRRCLPFCLELKRLE